jgi:uncharacterized membrane protein
VAGLLTVAEPQAPAVATRSRMLFVDALRGVALILMVINHTSRWWMDVSMGWGRYYLVYGSVTLPAAIFLFLVGFCLPISFGHLTAAERSAPWPVLGKYVGRGLVIILNGLLLNLLVFPEDPIWSGGVLQTIGLSIIVLAPALWLGRFPAARYGLLAVAALFYLSFVWAYADLSAWLTHHPLVAKIWFLDFAPWPWISMALIGLVAGWRWLEARGRGEREERRYFWIVGLVGLACVAAFFAYDWWMQTSPRVSFRRDFLLNRHWIPRGATTLWVLGMLGGLLAATYWLMEVKKRSLAWLVVLGQTALMLYFVHQLIVLTLINQYLGLRFNHWGLYWLANAALMVALVYLGQAWLEIKRVARRLRR